MTLPRLICTTILFTACTPAEKSLGEGEDDTGTTGGDPSPASDDISDPDDGATSMAPTGDGASTGGECAGLPIPPCEPDACAPVCGTTNVCVDGAWTCTCECSDTGEPEGSSTGGGDSGDTGAMTCEIVEAASELADQSKSPPIDCGDVTVRDPEDVWVAAHDCAVGAATLSEPFKVVADIQGIDSFPRRAFVGAAGLVYQLAQLDQDFGGFGGGPSPVRHRFCDAVVATPGCTPTVGEICLQCEGDSDDDIWCEP